MIDYFIENLTGIKNSQVKKAPKLDEALIHMIDWLGERDYKIYAWSESDRNQLLHEIKGKGQILRSTPNTAPLICGACNTQPEGLLTMA